ncbi:hypothetical protein ACWD26_26810 [Streptomyces sp. NPDC002787]
MGPVVQVSGSVGRLVVQEGTAAAEPPGPPHEDPWVRQARQSRVWDHVPPNRKVDEHRALVVAVAARLAVLRDAASQRLAADPWRCRRACPSPQRGGSSRSSGRRCRWSRVPPPASRQTRPPPLPVNGSWPRSEGSPCNSAVLGVTRVPLS